MVKNKFNKPVKSSEKRLEAPTINDFIPKGSYSELFILSPNQEYEACVEKLDVKLKNLSNSSVRITFIVENLK